MTIELQETAWYSNYSVLTIFSREVYCKNNIGKINEILAHAQTVDTRPFLRGFELAWEQGYNRYKVLWTRMLQCIYMYTPKVYHFSVFHMYMVFGEHLLMDVEVHVCDYMGNITIVDSRNWKIVEVCFRPSFFVLCINLQANIKQLLNHTCACIHGATRHEHHNRHHT